MKRPEVIFFDFGNTLIHFTGDWEEVKKQSITRLWKFLQKNNLKIDRSLFFDEFADRMNNYYVERSEDLIEYTSAAVLSDYLKSLGYHQIDSNLLKEAMRVMYAVSQEFWNLEEDAIALLDWIRANSMRLGVISNASDADDVYLMLNKFSLMKYFEHVIISANFGLRKPSPAIFLEAAALFKVQPAQCMMVGDRLDLDIQGANQVSIPSVWITRRCDPLDIPGMDQIIPDYQIDTLLELIPILDKMH